MEEFLMLFFRANIWKFQMILKECIYKVIVTQSGDTIELFAIYLLFNLLCVANAVRK